MLLFLLYSVPTNRCATFANNIREFNATYHCHFSDFEMYFMLKNDPKKLLFTILAFLPDVFGFLCFFLIPFCAHQIQPIFLEGEPLHCILLLKLKTTGRFTPLNLHNLTQCIMRRTFDIYTKITPRSIFGIVIVSSSRLYLNRTFEPIQMPQVRNLFRKTKLDKPF